MSSEQAVHLVINLQPSLEKANLLNEEQQQKSTPTSFLEMLAEITVRLEEKGPEDQKIHIYTPTLRTKNSLSCLLSEKVRYICRMRN